MALNLRASGPVLPLSRRQQQLIARKRERGHALIDSGTIIENLLHQSVHFLVERPERDAGGADFFAESAVDAASSHVNHPNQAER